LLPAWITGLAFIAANLGALEILGLARRRRQVRGRHRPRPPGININLWAGVVILAGGAIFLAWAVLRPLRAEDLQDTDTDRPKAE
jgi:hypothetical protein